MIYDVIYSDYMTTLKVDSIYSGSLWVEVN